MSGDVISNLHSWLFRYAYDAISPAQKRIEVLNEKILKAEQAKEDAER